MGEFIVQKGQTLSQIAKMHNTTVEAIAKQNGIKDVNKISIGQKLTIGSKPKETKKSELGDIDKRIAANQKEIEKLQAQGISDLVKKDINALEAELKGLGKQAYAEMMKEVKAAEKKLIAAYRKGSDAYAKVRKEVIKEFNIALGAAKAVFDGAVDAAKQGAKKVVRTGKKAARNVRDGLKMKERPVIRKTPDFSKMTKDQILAYQQKEIQKLKMKE